MYQSLDAGQKEIRTLIVKAGRPDEAIRCELRVISLCDASVPDYETISYVWGRSRDRSTIFIDGLAISVPLNTERVLHRFRHDKLDRTVWLDAVCINQDDVAERSQQVAIMDEVYSRTMHGLIWLGEDDGFALEAKMAIEQIAKEARAETKDFATLSETLSVPRFSQTGFSVSVDLDPVLKLFALPWFQRLWVIQEAALAGRSTCACGDIEVSLIDIMTCARWLGYKAHYLPFDYALQAGLTATMLMSQYADWEGGTFTRRSEFTLSLRYLLSGSQVYGATDPKDHVYAVIGLYRKFANVPALPKLLRPDYTKQLREVFRDATRYDMEVSGRLNSLMDLSRRPEDIREYGDWPTWVPLWHRKPDPEHDPGDIPFVTDASATERSRLLDSTSPKVLSVYGIRRTSIAQVSPTILPDMMNTAKAFQHTIHSFRQMLSECATDDDEDLMDIAFAVSLCTGADASGAPIREEYAMRLMKLWSKYLAKHGDLPPRQPHIQQKEGLLPDPEVVEAWEFDYLLWNHCRNRRFLVTADGSPGLGPQLAKSGDVVAVLYGCRWPVVLQPRAEEGHFDALGICYVYGIMDGEAVRKHRSLGVADDVFHIH